MKGSDKRRQRKAGRKIGYLATAVCNGALLYVANNVLSWGIPFLTSDFNEVLPWFNAVFIGNIVINVLFVAFDSPRFVHFATLVTSIIGFVAVYLLYAMYPFSIEESSWDLVARILLIVGMVGSGIACVVEFVKMVLGKE